MTKILVVEDEYDIRELLQNYLGNEGYQVLNASDGEEALMAFQQFDADLILLDIMLPKLNGYEVCKAIREISDVPVIMLTALDSEYNQLKGFDLQIDDYIPKPFSMPILLRKIDAVLRRAAGTGLSKQITYKDLQLLKALLQNQGHVLSRQSLLNRVWSYDFYGDERIVDTHIKNLRKKIKY